MVSRAYTRKRVNSIDAVTAQTRVQWFLTRRYKIQFITRTHNKYIYIYIRTYFTFKGYIVHFVRSVRTLAKTSLHLERSYITRVLNCFRYVCFVFNRNNNRTLKKKEKIQSFKTHRTVWWLSNENSGSNERNIYHSIHLLSSATRLYRVISKRLPYTGYWRENTVSTEKNHKTKQHTVR